MEVKTETVQIGDIFKELQAPCVKFDVFKGDPTVFPYFITTFTQAVEEKITEERGRLVRLIKYTEGDANQLVKRCIYLPQSDFHKITMLLLKEKYGNPFKIAAE